MVQQHFQMTFSYLLYAKKKIFLKIIFILVLIFLGINLSDIIFPKII